MKSTAAAFITAASFLVWAGDGMAAQIRLYERDRFSGSALQFLSKNAWLPDTIGTTRSARVLSGRWLICDLPNFGGNCIWLSRSIKSFGMAGFAGTIRSVMPLDVPVIRREWGDRGAPPRSVLALFRDTEFRGDWIGIRDSSSNLSMLQLQNPAKSVVVQSGIWKLCSLPNYEGRCIIMTTSAWDMEKVFPNAIIRSVQKVE